MLVGYWYHITKWDSMLAGYHSNMRQTDRQTDRDRENTEYHGRFIHLIIAPHEGVQETERERENY